MTTKKLKWEKLKHAPIPDYNSTDNRWRIFRSTHRGCWCLQDRHSPNHPEPVSYHATLVSAKGEATYQAALSEFNEALAGTPPSEVEQARSGCGLRAARFACQYVRPEKDQALYNRIYDIFWNHFHKEANQCCQSIS